LNGAFVVRPTAENATSPIVGPGDVIFFEFRRANASDFTGPFRLFLAVIRFSFNLRARAKFFHAKRPTPTGRFEASSRRRNFFYIIGAFFDFPGQPVIRRRQALSSEMATRTDDPDDFRITEIRYA